MSGYDWYSWYPVHYRRSTRHLTNDQDLMYRRLIDEYMETREAIPDNDIAIANIVRYSIDEWKMARAILLPFFCQADGKLYNKKCDEILAGQMSLSKKKSNSGALGAKKRWKKSIDNKEENSTCYSRRIADAWQDDGIRQDKIRYISSEAKASSDMALNEKKLKLEEKKHARDRGCKIEIWLKSSENIPDELSRWCTDALGWNEDRIEIVWREFFNYWKGVPGQRANKRDWPATWRNRCYAKQDTGNRYAGNPKPSKSEAFKRNLAEGTLADITANQRPSGDEEAGDTGGRLF